jgi:peptidoglycan/xylan/chitin deacetylase (PgdA/CDA1 family)
MSSAIFFRDDDADLRRPELERLVELFAGAGLPLNVAVIPGTLTSDCAAWLAARGDWLDVHQHGWVHANHEANGRKSEFGPSRPYEQQRSDIAQGQSRMNQLLGSRWTPVFTPPWNRCSAETHQALMELGFRAVSQDSSAPPPVPALRSVPVTVDLFTWKTGRQLKPIARLKEETQSALSGAGPVGILLHHKVMDDRAFEVLALLVNWLRCGRSYRFLTLAELLEDDACRN